MPLSLGWTDSLSVNLLRLPAVKPSTRMLSRAERLAAALLVGALMFVAVTATAAPRSTLVECRGAGCEAEGVTPDGVTTGVPVREPAPACLRDAGCGGGASGASSGLVLAALPGALVVVLAARSRRAVRPASDALLSLLFGRQLYRPPRLA